MPSVVNGFDRYERFFASAPAIVVEWHDDQTPARGWLAINSLHGGAAGGGTRMRVGGSRQEAVFLGKTMAVKFRVCGPDIGGGKSVIDFDASSAPAVKRGVLERWYRHIGPYLKSCYGTGGDVGVDEVSEATEITERVLGIKHPQEGIVRGCVQFQKDGEPAAMKIDRLRHGVEARVTLKDLPGPRDGAWMVADVATGFGVVRSIERYYQKRGMKLEGQRAIVEGFGAVGAFAAYYLAKLGVRIVAASSHGTGRNVRVARDPQGLDANRLIQARDGTRLPAAGASGAGKATVTDSPTGEELFEHEAEIYVPAATSHTITMARVERMKRAGVKVVACGANNPFHADQGKPSLTDWVADMLVVQRVADREFAIIPDFVANCGMARTFGFLMDRGGSTKADAILVDTGWCIDNAMDRLLKDHARPTGLLEHAYSIFVPER